MSLLKIETPATVDLSLILRGLFASSVVFWHVLGWKLDGQVWAGLNLPGRASVWMFFGLSGYVIGYGFFSGRYSIDLRGILAFYRRRASRILPLFWVTSSLALFAAWAGMLEFDLSLGNVAAALFMLQWSHLTYPVGVFWTLGIEMQFYIIAPLLCWMVLRAGRHWPWLSVAVLGALCGVYGDQPDLRTLAGVIMFFLLGLVMARWRLSASLQPSRGGFLIFLALGCLSLIVASDAYPERFWNYVGPAFVMLALFFLLRAHAVLEEMQVASGQVTRVLMVVGTLAYGIYAWHGLLTVLWPLVQGSLVLNYGASVGLAWLSFCLMERPFIRRFGRKAA